MGYKPKYTARFESTATFYKKDLSKDGFVSKASVGLDELMSLLPEQEEIANNPDLLYTCFNAAVANLINLNGDGITTEGAKNLIASCKNKPMNIEHDRSNVVGFIINHGFSSFGENKILTSTELSNDPFNISLAAIVWKICNRGFTEFIQESQDEDGFCYKAVSTSWEVGFDSYKLAVGSKDLRKARFIEDEEEVESYSKYLLSMGGTGFLPTGEEVYRVIGDECIFLGCAFTTNPAAAVQGVASIDYKDIEDDDDDDLEEEEMDEEDDESDASIDESPAGESQVIETAVASVDIIFNKNAQEISPTNKKRVIKRMKYNTIDELVDNLQEAHGSDVRDFIVSQVEKANDKFVALQVEKDAAAKALADAIASVEDFEGQTKQLKAEVDELRASIKAQEDQVKFGERMESLKEQFEIDQAVAKVISKKIFGLSDESFAEWLEEMKPLLKVKSQEVSVSTASVNAPLPNSQAPAESKVEEWRKLLADIKPKVTI